MRNSSKIWFPGVLSFLVLTGFMLVPFTGEAYEKGWKPSAEGVICRLEARLDLTPEQKEKLLPIVRQEMEQRREMVEEHHRAMSQYRNEFRETMAKERENTEQRFSSVLTAGQMEELGKMADERRERCKEKRHRGKFHGPRGCW